MTNISSSFNISWGGKNKKDDSVSQNEKIGFKPDWDYWLMLYEVDVFSAVQLSKGICPTNNSEHLAQPITPVIVTLEESKKLNNRLSIIESYIGNMGQPIFFDDLEKFAKIHAKIKLVDFVKLVTEKLKWDLPPELDQLVIPKIRPSNTNEVKRYEQLLSDDALLRLSGADLLANALHPKLGVNVKKLPVKTIDEQLQEKDKMIDELKLRIAELEAQHQTVTQQMPKQSSQTRAANNAAKIIGALAEMNKLDLTQPQGQANKDIKATLEKLGSTLSKDTIGNWIKLANDQLK